MMNYGEAFNFCMSGGKIKATKRYDTGELVSWIIRYDKSLDRFERQILPRIAPAIHSALFLGVDQTSAELDRWTFEDAEPEPTFKVRAEVDDDAALCVSIFWRGGLVIGTDRDDAVQLYEALGEAIKCASCGAYFAPDGTCGEHTSNERLRREHLEYRLGLERDQLAYLERTRPPTDGLITVSKSTIIQLEAMLKGAI